MFTPVVIEHFSNPRCVGELENPTHGFEVGNSVCGDRIFVDMIFSGDRTVSDIRFRAYGCATSIATGSLFCEVVTCHDLGHILSMTREQQHALLGEMDPSQMHCRDLLEQLFVKLRETCAPEGVTP